MGRWVGSRCLRAFIVVWLTATIVFFALRATGDPLQAILGGPGSQASAETVAAAINQYGLDRPLIEQYLLQLWQLATLDLGTSFSRRVPVGDLLMAQLPGTLLLAALALVLAWCLAFVGAFVTAVVRGRIGRIVDQTMRGLETVATVMPQFWLGAVLIVIFASGLGWLPATSASSTPPGLVLPVITLAIPIAGFLTQVSRDALREADRSPFATTSRSRGSSELRVLLHHTLRHAGLPALALSGWAFGSLLSGSVVVEVLFARPGLGRVLQEAALARDVPVVIGAVSVIAVMYVVVMILTDLAELLIDPRLRRAESSVSAHTRRPLVATAVGS